MTAAPPLRVEPRRSLVLGLLTALLVVLALLALLHADLHPWLYMGASLLLGAALAQTWQRWRHPRVLAFELDGAQTRLWLNGESEPRAARVRQARMLGPLLVIDLAWQGGRQPHHAALWLLPDSLDAFTLRALRMRLSAHADGS